jgi:UDP-galactopyranose mutase
MRVAILGGGLAGLSAALHIPAPHTATVFEQEEKPGGLATSDVQGGATFDHGVHVLHTKDEELLAFFEEMVGFMPTQRQKARIFSHDIYTKFPFQANTYGLPIDVVKDCLLEFIKVTYEGKQTGSFANYREWMYAVYGRGICEHFMVPYSRKMWTVEPEELNTEWMAPRFARPSLEEVIEGALHEQPKEFGANARFRYPEHGGAERISASLARCVKDVRLRHRVVALDTDRRIATFANGLVERFDVAIATIPLPVLVRALRPLPPLAIREAAAQLRWLSIFTINWLVDREQVTEDHWAYFLDERFPFFRLSFPGNIGRGNIPAGKTAIQCEISHTIQKPIDRSSVVQASTDSLWETGLLRAGDRVEVVGVRDLPFAYVLFTHGRRDFVEMIHRYLLSHGIYPAGRFGEWGYLWMHDAVVSGRQAALQAVRVGTVSALS